MHGDTIDLLYYCNRPGWAVPPDTPDLAAVLDDCTRQGARYLVIAAPEETLLNLTDLQSHASVRRGDGFFIYRLQPRQ